MAVMGVALLALGLWWVSVASPTAASPTTRYVAPGGACAGATPCYASLQAAVEAAMPGDEIRVAQGVYTDVHTITYELMAGYPETVTQTLFISKSLTVRGGYTTTDWTTAQPMTYPTVIDPQGGGRGVFITIPSYQSEIAVLLEGLTIIHGYARLDAGALYAHGANVTLRNCHIYSNTGGSIGGGLYFAGGTVTLTNNTITDNAGPEYSHGVVVDGSRSAYLAGNRIMRSAGGLFFWNSWATLVNNVIAANAHDGLSISGGEVQAWHTTIADNGERGISVGNSGQLIGHLTITNSIIAGNGIGVSVSGVAHDPSTVQLTATLWHNLTETEIVEGGLVTHTWDFDGDPAFVGDGDYHLTAASPARNRGWASGVRQDIDGEPRDPLPDLGADEYFDPESIRQVYLPLVMR